MKNKIQIGGNHYKDMKIQPVDYITQNGLSYLEGNVVKYVSRWRKKGGMEDLRKAKHYVEMLIEEAQHGDLPIK
tara:strand:- start:986 stop:1207 length:222 start_codon:yes stop_codon:yes gene_type:complete